MRARVLRRAGQHHAKAVDDAALPDGNRLGRKSGERGGDNELHDSIGDACLHHLEPRGANPGVGARPALRQVGVDLRRRGAAAGERFLQTEQRPAVVRVIVELFAIDALGIGVALRLEQRRTQPMARGERQRLGFVVGEAVFNLRRPLERRNRAGEIAAAPQDLPFENAGDGSEQIPSPDGTGTSPSTSPRFS